MFRLSRAVSYSPIVLFVLFCTVCNIHALAQDSCPWPGIMKQKKVTNVTVPGTDMIHSYLERLPDDYNSTTKKYPLIIAFHGVAESVAMKGDDLCALLGEWFWIPSSLAERTSSPMFPSSVTTNGQTYQFILISPQLTYFGDANACVNSFITYLSSRYRVDISRVYLTGISAGANLIDSYVSTSLANAKRVAAIAPVSPCDGLSTQGAKNIANAGLPVWSVQCSSDNMCPGGTAASIANSINSQNPVTSARATATTLPVPNWPCNVGLAHDAWGTAYHPDFRQTINGKSVNLYEWMLQSSRTALLPVVLESYTVQLLDDNVHVKWTTSAEKNNAKFTIERSTDGVKFTEVANIPATNNTTGKSYEWIDSRPLPNLSYYRLSQTDLDGRREYFQIRKIMNRSLQERTIIVAPNPFTTELTAFINVPRTQQITATVSDLSGRTIKTVYGKYAEGAAEININTTDLPKGLYLLKVKGEDFSQIQKIVKQ